MSWAAKGAYMEVLCHLWDRGPMTLDEIKKVLPGLRSRDLTKIRQKLANPWPELGERVSQYLTNLRLERERVKTIALSEKRKEIGKLGGKAKAKAVAIARNLLEQTPSKISSKSLPSTITKDSSPKSLEKPGLITPPEPAVISPVKKKKRDPVLTFWPKDFKLTPSLRDYARRQNITYPEKCFEDFRVKAIARKYKYASWSYAFMSWCRSDLQKKGEPEIYEPDLSQEGPPDE
jgi:hypothetical protein